MDGKEQQILDSALGKMRNINPQVSALTLINYLSYANLFKGILSNKLDSSKKEFEGFIDIFTKGILEFEVKKESG